MSTDRYVGTDFVLSLDDPTMAAHPVICLNFEGARARICRQVIGIFSDL